MICAKLWQEDEITKVTDLLKSLSNVQSVILKGSFCDDGLVNDQWSDIDFVVLLNDNSADRFLSQTEWLKPFGQIFAIDRTISEMEMTLRICFDGYRRFDFTFINSDNTQRIDCLSDPYKILYSKSDDQDSCLTSVSSKKSFSVPSDKEIDEFINKFWFTGVVAIGKIARKDYLVSSHLALEMAQSCIVLQMMIRDKKKGTNIHKTGESEDVEILDRLVGETKGHSLLDRIIKLINDSATSFDNLAKEYQPEYCEHFPKFKEWVNNLRDTAQAY